MHVQYKFIETANPVFHHGKNMGTKLGTGRQTGLILMHNEEKKRVEIYYEGQYSHVNDFAVCHCIPEDPAQDGYFIHVAKATVQKQQSMASAPIRAQVENPVDKVQNPPQRRTVHKDITP
jgi:hypothetical protein